MDLRSRPRALDMAAKTMSGLGLFSFLVALCLFHAWQLRPCYKLHVFVILLGGPVLFQVSGILQVPSRYSAKILLVLPAGPMTGLSGNSFSSSGLKIRCVHFAPVQTRARAASAMNHYRVHRSSPHNRTREGKPTLTKCC